MEGLLSTGPTPTSSIEMHWELITGQKTEHVTIGAETWNLFSRHKRLFQKSLLSAKAKAKFKILYEIFKQTTQF